MKDSRIAITATKIAVHAMLVLGIVVGAPGLASAQLGSVTDAATPLAIEPGAPAGSYPLSGFDTVNLYGGHLSFALPLLRVGGRGGASYTMTLPVDPFAWTVRRFVLPDSQILYFPQATGWAPSSAGYGPGLLIARTSGVVNEGTPAGCNFPAYYGTTLTRLTFILPDGTEQGLRDVLTNGQPIDNLNGACYGGALPNRGTVFTSADGGSMTFVSDAPISDSLTFPAQSTFSGYLMLRDGTRYDIDTNGRVTRMRDRNGNTLTFQYDSNSRVTSITDSLKRQITVTYGTYDEIVFKGSGESNRSIRVLRNNLIALLRADSPSLKTYAELFPQLDGSSTTSFGASRISGVELPDGRFYRFQYNPYGELARVELPTGGVFEYDYQGTGSSSISTEGLVWFDDNPGIYRRLTKRRIYEAPSYLERETTFDCSISDYLALGQAEAAASTTVTVTDRNPQGIMLSNTRHVFHGSPTKSLFQQAIHYPGYRAGKEKQTDQLNLGAGTPLKTTTHLWQNRTTPGWWPPSTLYTYFQSEEPPSDPRDVETVTTLVDTNQVAKKTAIDPANSQNIGFDQFNNPTDVWEYDYGTGAPGPLKRRTHTDYLTINGGANYATGTNIHLRGLPSMVTVYDPSGQAEASTAYEYDNYTPDATHAALVTCHSGNCGTVSGLDGAFTSSYTTRGNVTAVGRWVKANNSWIFTYQHYDVVGNVVKSIDPRGKQTTIFFDDQFGTPNGNVADSTLPSELQGAKTYALPTKIINPLGHTTETQYDYYLGRPVDSKDANGVITSGGSSDPLDRPSWVVRAHSTPEQHLTLFSYDDLNRIVATTADKDVYNDQQIKTQVVYDGLGREVETRQYEGPNNFIATRKQYDALGRVLQVSNPFRLAPQHWTVTQYDALSRVTAVIAPGGAVTTTVYSGNATTVTDPALKTRASLTDALGRLTQMTENPGGLNYVTSYSYDALGNLRTVTQGGQTRTFAYDSLSRLTSGANPESGTVSYQYDPGGNLIQKVDARAVITTLTYDDLNRVVAKSYSDGTPAVSYCYDGTGTGCPSPVANAKVRMTKVSSSVSSTSFDEFDPMGRVKRTTQTLGESGYTFVYGYNLAGGMKSQVYPSGRTVNTTFDPALRISSLAGSKAGEPGKTYASNFQYSPHGGIEAMKLGNELWESAHYNERLQPDLMGLGTANGNSNLFRLNYGYGAPANNNGNMLSQAITVGATGLTQSYGYDPLNRLLTATEGSNWLQTYEYDRYGNRWVTPSSYIQAAALTPQALSHFDSSNNRLVGSGYDLAGNLTTDATNRTFTYDAENRQTSVTTPGQGPVTYSYDGEGRRVKKTQGGEDTIYVYNVLGQLAAEFSAQGPQGAGGTQYLTADHLGSTRVVTDQSRVVKARHDYLPFGEEIPASVGRSTIAGYGGTDGIRQKFTGKERDAETGLDYFEARYFSSAQGRFTSTDPIISGPHKLNDPQNWNLYVYARNNPLRFTDPTGEIIEEQIDDEYKKRYERWKKDYLSTSAGRRQWDRYANDPNFTLTITFDKAKKQGAEAGNYQWDSSGNLAAATITLGPKLDSGFPSSVSYPITSSLQGANVSGTTLAVTKFAHEFGHVNRTGQENAALFQLQNQLIPQYNSLFFSSGRNPNHPGLKALEQQMGGTPIDINIAREHWGEANTVPYLRDRFPAKSMPNQIKQAIENYQKAYPGRFP